MATADLGSDSDIEPSGDIELAGSASVIGKFSVSHGILIGCDYGYDVTSGLQL